MDLNDFYEQQQRYFSLPGYFRARVIQGVFDPESGADSRGSLEQFKVERDDIIHGVVFESHGDNDNVLHYSTVHGEHLSFDVASGEALGLVPDTEDHDYWRWDLVDPSEGGVFQTLNLGGIELSRIEGNPLVSGYYVARLEPELSNLERVLSASRPESLPSEWWQPFVCVDLRVLSVANQHVLTFRTLGGNEVALPVNSSKPLVFCVSDPGHWEHGEELDGYLETDRTFFDGEQFRFLVHAGGVFDAWPLSGSDINLFIKTELPDSDFIVERLLEVIPETSWSFSTLPLPEYALRAIAHLAPSPDNDSLNCIGIELILQDRDEEEGSGPATHFLGWRQPEESRESGTAPPRWQSDDFPFPMIQAATAMEADDPWNIPGRSEVEISTKWAPELIQLFDRQREIPSSLVALYSDPPGINIFLGHQLIPARKNDSLPVLEADEFLTSGLARVVEEMQPKPIRLPISKSALRVNAKFLSHHLSNERVCIAVEVWVSIGEADSDAGFTNTEKLVARRTHGKWSYGEGNQWLDAALSCGFPEPLHLLPFLETVPIDLERAREFVYLFDSGVTISQDVAALFSDPPGRTIGAMDLPEAILKIGQKVLVGKDSDDKNLEEVVGSNNLAVLQAVLNLGLLTRLDTFVHVLEPGLRSLASIHQECEQYWASVEEKVCGQLKRCQREKWSSVTLEAKPDSSAQLGPAYLGEFNFEFVSHPYRCRLEASSNHGVLGDIFPELVAELGAREIGELLDEHALDLLGFEKLEETNHTAVYERNFLQILSPALVARLVVSVLRGQFPNGTCVNFFITGMGQERLPIE